MICSLRTKHLWIVLALALALPLLLVVALVSRPEAPFNDQLPEGARTFADDTRGDR